MRYLRFSVLWTVCLLALLGCKATSESHGQVARDEIQAVLEVYLPLLGQAYASGDLEPLAPWAAEKEISRIRKHVEDLGEQGRTLVPTFRQLTVEDVNIWNYSNAYVTTLEVWDLVVYATGTDQELSQELEQPNRVKYQLKRGDDHWRVLFREKQE